MEVFLTNENPEDFLKNGMGVPSSIFPEPVDCLSPTRHTPSELETSERGPVEVFLTNKILRIFLNNGY